MLFLIFLYVYLWLIVLNNYVPALRQPASGNTSLPDVDSSRFAGCTSGTRKTFLVIVLIVVAVVVIIVVVVVVIVVVVVVLIVVIVVIVGAVNLKWPSL